MSSKAFTAIVIAVIATLILLMFCALREDVVKVCVENTTIQKVEYEGHDYLLFIRGEEGIKAAIHSESCHCKK